MVIHFNIDIGFHFSYFTDLAAIFDFTLDFDFILHLDRDLLKLIALELVYKGADVFVAIIINSKAIINFDK